MKHFSKIHNLYTSTGYPAPKHPLFGMAILENSGNTSGKNLDYTSDFYLIGYKNVQSGLMQYGKTKYDYERGTMFFFKPRQKISIRDVKLIGKGCVLHIHENFLLDHPLYHRIKEYEYFDYEAHEALHLSPQEEEIIWELHKKLDIEYHSNPDEYSRSIMLAHIDTILQYAQRFYKRQFINRKYLSGTMVTKFNNYLKEYFAKGQTKELGLPNVNYMSQQLNISPKYLSDLLKIETGKTALELIHLFIISEAKNLLAEKEISITEIAYVLGFENPPYFSRLFKKSTGQTPLQFRQSLN